MPVFYYLMPVWWLSDDHLMFQEQKNEMKDKLRKEVYYKVKQGRKGNKQVNSVIKTGLSCNSYLFFPVAGKIM